MGGLGGKDGCEGDVAWDYGRGESRGIECVGRDWEGEEGGGCKAHGGDLEVFEVN